MSTDLHFAGWEGRQQSLQVRRPAYSELTMLSRFEALRQTDAFLEKFSTQASNVLLYIVIS
jgi:hypothetical protein